jgi:hypothetical protein
MAVILHFYYFLGMGRKTIILYNVYADRHDCLILLSKSFSYFSLFGGGGGDGGGGGVVVLGIKPGSLSMLSKLLCL